MGTHTHLDNSHLLIDGQFVSAKISRIVEAIKAYEPELEVQWLPPGARNPGQAAFKIIHNAPGNAPYTMFHVNTEEEFDDRVLYRIIYNDQRKTGQQQYSEVEAWEKAQRLVSEQARLDAIEEANDIAYHVFKSPKHTYKVSKDLTIKDGIPFNAKRLEG